VSVFDEMADLLERCGRLCLPDGGGGKVIRRHPNSQADFDALVFLRDLETKDPAGWISHAVGTYLYEIGYELQALGLLLRASLGPGSFELVVRAIVERAGRISWILEEGTSEEECPTLPGEGLPVGVRRRAIRASFELLVSQQHYRASLETLRVEKRFRNRARDLLRDKRVLVAEWFGVEKPPLDPCDPESQPTPWIAEWTIGGEEYPKYEALARWALSDESLSNSAVGGTYAALSGWSHPNFIASAEHLADQGFQYRYDGDYLHRLFGLAISSTDTALKCWLGYYDHNHDATVDELFAATTAWEGLGKPDDEERKS
jgi:hypothetical protein